MNFLQQSITIPFWWIMFSVILLLIAGNYCGSITTIERIKQKKIRL